MVSAVLCFCLIKDLYSFLKGQWLDGALATNMGVVDSVLVKGMYLGCVFDSLAQVELRVRGDQWM